MSTYLVTGSMGCIGAWTLAELVRRGDQVISFDLSENRGRLDLVLDRDGQDQITFVQGDLTNADVVAKAVVDHDVSRVIHLAALQVPFCKADPILGSRVNVTGTVNVFEAARHAGLPRIAFASSIAVYGPPDAYEHDVLPTGSRFDPRTLYGVYKQANEGTARVFAQDYDVASVALRPYTVYGVGRDQGLTSDPTKSMLAAAGGKRSSIGFGGRMQFQFARDVARAFILAADSDLDGAQAFDMGGPITPVSEVAEIIESVTGVQVDVKESPLPFPDGVNDDRLEHALSGYRPTPLAEGIEATIADFERHLAAGSVSLGG